MQSEFNFNGNMIRPSGDAENFQALKEFSVAYLRHEQDLDLEAFNVNFDIFSLESSLIQKRAGRAYCKYANKKWPYL